MAPASRHLTNCGGVRRVEQEQRSVRVKQETGRADGARDLRDPGRGELTLGDELAPLPDWSRLGRHILAEAMRRAMARMEARIARSVSGADPQAKELS